MKKLNKKTYLFYLTMVAILSTFFASCLNINEKEESFTPHKKNRVAVVLNDRMGTETSQLCEKELSENWFIVNSFPETPSSEEETISIHKSDLLSVSTLTTLIVPDFSIRVIHYPADFTRGRITRVGDIRNILDDELVNAVVFMDPQERTDAFLSNLREARPDIRFYCLMPTESVLAMEAWCNIVLSFSLPLESKVEDLDSEDTFIDPLQMSKALKVLCLIAKDNINKQQEQTNTRKITPQELSTVENKLILFEETQNWKCGWYIDSDSGLRSQNHIVVTP